MNGFLIDTDICVFRIRGCDILESKFDVLDNSNLFLSEITIAELRFGAERGNRKTEQHRIIDWMCKQYTVLPITDAIRLFAVEKARLYSIGMKVDDFDLLIGATAVYHKLVLVTNNTKHFERMQSLKVEN
jgi:tRNA(fMet)-specific endonuclease VapC